MKESDTTIIVDSEMDFAKALAQDPKNQAPAEILNVQKLIPVEYYSFDDAVHRGQIVMHANVVEDIVAFFNLALKIKFPIKSAVPISGKKYEWNDERSCTDNNSSGFNYRLVSGTNRLSKHAQGLAFDINPVQNVYIRYDQNLNETFRFPASSAYDEKAPGTLTADHFLVVCMKSLGWEWGGDWTPASGRVDYQHFEKKLK